MTKFITYADDYRIKGSGKNMLRRFIQYYRPHMPLFILDMAVSTAGAALAILIPYLTRKILQQYLAREQMNMVLFILALMVGIITLKAVLHYIQLKWGHILGARMEADMRGDFFRHIQKLSFSYFDNTKTGHIMSRISNDLNTIAEVAHHCPEDLLIAVLLIIGAFSVMFHINWQLALIAAVPFSPLLGWGLYYGRKMRKGFRNVRKRIADINSNVENSVQGIREVKAYTNEEREISKFDEVNFDFRMAKEEIYGILGTFFSGVTFLTEAYIVTVIAGGVWLIYLGRLDVADLLAFVMYIYFIFNPIHKLVSFTEQIQQGAASFERYLEVMDIEPEIVDAKDAHTFEPVRGEIEISGLWFKYDGSYDWVLEDCDLIIPANANVAIVGESGAGKSTLVSLIPRFYEPSKGKITIDRHNIMQLKQKFIRDNIGLVQQSVFLFDSTIRDNIMYGRSDASEEEMIEAARKANILDYIESLPDKFDTLVGERGVKLSGGQKQRISIARVFLKDPAVFIFDEATSSLDTESESLIQKSLELLRRNRTTIIIAHRLSTVRNADLLYVLKQGRVVEQGTHRQLIDKGEYYHRLYSMNLIGV